MCAMHISNVTLSQLRIIVAVADVGSFTLASERLGMTQPGVSHAVKAIERQLDVSLFKRRREGVALTPAGHVALKEARSALIHLQRLEAVGQSQASIKGTTLRLSLFPSTAGSDLPNRIAAFHKRYPDVHVNVRADSDEDIVNAIRNREIDLGMVTAPHQEFPTFPAFDDELVAVVPNAPRWGRVRTIDAEALSKEAFLMTVGGCESLVRSIFTSAGAAPRVRLSVESKDLLLALVREGIGVTIVPSSVVLTLCRRGLRVIPLRPRTFRRVAFAALSMEALSPTADAFLTMVSKPAALSLT